MTAHRVWTRSISSKDRDFISGNGINEVDIALSLCYYNKNGVEEDMVSSCSFYREIGHMLKARLYSALALPPRSSRRIALQISRTGKARYSFIRVTGFPVIRVEP